LRVGADFVQCLLAQHIGIALAGLRKLDDLPSDRLTNDERLLIPPCDWYQLAACSYAVPVIGRIISVTLFSAPLSVLLSLIAHYDDGGDDCEQDDRYE
jgi:hypothetical protein